MNNEKVRIIERTNVDGEKTWLIQHRHWLFKWKWVYAQVDFPFGSMNAVFYSLKDAKKNLCYYDGSEPKYKVLKIKKGGKKK